MKYKVKITIPTILEIDNKEYSLFPDSEIDLPDANIVETFKELNYIEPIQAKPTKTAKTEAEVNNVS